MANLKKHIENNKNNTKRKKHKENHTKTTQNNQNYENTNTITNENTIRNDSTNDYSATSEEINEEENIHKTKKILQPKIFNLSKLTLSSGQINILLNGLKFTPTPKTNTIQLKSDIQDFSRKLRLNEFFYKEDVSDIEPASSNDPLLKNNSKFYPPRNRNRDLDHNIDLLSNLDLESIQIREKSNFTKHDWRELNNLANDHNIVIKRADKGGAVVILSKQHYKEMILKHLDDEKVYKKVTVNIDKTIQKQLFKHIDKYKNQLHKNEISALKVSTYNTSNFYGLPKIHKSKEITDTITTQNKELIILQEPKDLSLRPIVGGPNCLTKKLSLLIDILLKPFIKHIKSYIKDSVDFLNKCQRTVNEDCLIVTFDVKSLYTSIPHDLGLKAVDYFLTTFNNELHPRFSKQFILESVNFILKNNSLTFDELYYLQLQGTAMGTIFAPTYASLTMAFHETSLYDVIENKFGDLAKNYFVENWKRFLDDCEILLDISLIDPNNLLNILNSINENIQFTMEVSNNNLPFLDISINKVGTRIWMDIYSKPTD